jgi:hypothetical protein
MKITTYNFNDLIKEINAILNRSKKIPNSTIDAHIRIQLDNILNTGLNKTLGQIMGMKGELDYAIKHSRKNRAIRFQTNADIIVESGNGKVAEIKSTTGENNSQVKAQLIKALNQLSDNLPLRPSNLKQRKVVMYINNGNNNWPLKKNADYNVSNFEHSLSKEFEFMAKAINGDINQKIIVTKKKVNKLAELKRWLHSNAGSNVLFANAGNAHRLVQSDGKVINQVNIKIEHVEPLVLSANESSYSIQKMGGIIYSDGKEILFKLFDMENYYKLKKTKRK